MIISSGGCCDTGLLVILRLRLAADSWVVATLTAEVAVEPWKGVVVGSGIDFVDCSLNWGARFVEKAGCLTIMGFGTRVNDELSGMEVFCTFLSFPAFLSAFLSSGWIFGLKKRGLIYTKQQEENNHTSEQEGLLDLTMASETQSALQGLLL